MFTAMRSQMQAERAGFEVRYCLNYEEFVDEQGDPVFPNIDCKNVKMMSKVLP